MPTPAEHMARPGARAAATAWLDTPVRNIMRAGVISVPADASVRQVQRALVSHEVHAVLVVKVDSGEPIGWATTRTVLAHMLSDAALIPAKAVATEPIHSISPSATAEEALSQMLEKSARHLLVRRHVDSPPEGVIAEIDLVELSAPR